MNYKIYDEKTYKDFSDELKKLSESDYKEFNTKITPSPDSEILGIRVPKLREIAKKIAKEDALAFFNTQDTTAKTKPLCHEEIIIYGLVIGYAKFPFGEMCERIRRYSHFVNNWACCDCPISSFKQIRKLKEEYKIEIYAFLKSSNPWQVRVGLIILLDHYLSDKDYVEYVLSSTNSINSENYYVQMAQAWIISTAFIKHTEYTKDFLKNTFSLSENVKKYTVRKIRDSYRVSDEDKNWVLGI